MLLQRQTAERPSLPIGFGKRRTADEHVHALRGYAESFGDVDRDHELGLRLGDDPRTSDCACAVAFRPGTSSRRRVLKIDAIATVVYSADIV